jgi:lipopolysaccharide export system protein LptA
MTRSPARLIAAAWFGATLLGAAPLGAQPASGPPNALQGFSQNRDKPIKINAATLEVRDKDKTATFAGDVHLVQGDTTLRSKTLVVFYDDDAAVKSASAPATAAVAQPKQQIRRAEAKGGVIVTQKDQTATGDNGVFDMRANTVTLQGNVVISQCQNVVRGDRLTVDMTTGVSRVEGGRGEGGRVQALILPGGPKPEQHCSESPHAAAPAAAPTRDTQRKSAPQPSGLY